MARFALHANRAFWWVKLFEDCSESNVANGPLFPLWGDGQRRVTHRASKALRSHRFHVLHWPTTIRCGIGERWNDHEPP